MTHGELINWVANASEGDPLPSGYQEAQGFLRLVERLIVLGVVREPAQGETFEAIMMRAGKAARDWLDAGNVDVQVVVTRRRPQEMGLVETRDYLDGSQR